MKKKKHGYIEKCRNHVDLLPHEAASWTRNQLASSLRSRNAYSVNLLLGGFDTAHEVPLLYWIDYLGTMAQVPYAAHGYGAYFCLSTMDRFHSPDMDLQQGLCLLKRCIDELSTRFIVNLGSAYYYYSFFEYLDHGRSSG
jgi:20S proteasome subunit beta 4